MILRFPTWKACLGEASTSPMYMWPIMTILQHACNISPTFLGSRVSLSMISLSWLEIHGFSSFINCDFVEAFEVF
jgi:hypothetical protein